MELQLTRRSGFYGMGSPLEVMQGKKRIAAINHQQTIFLALAEQTPIRVRMFFLESQPFQLPKGQSALKLEVVMNPALKRIYRLLFKPFSHDGGIGLIIHLPLLVAFCRCVFSGIFCLCFDLFKKSVSYQGGSSWLVVQINF